ncbi:MAG: SpoIIIAH-like family protein [Bacillota bacterium]
MKDFYIIHQRRIWSLVALLVFAGLFGYGYFRAIPAEIPKSPPFKEPSPLKIPREYSPNDSLLDLKIERDRERSREVEKVQELLEQIGLSDEVRKQAEQELWRLTQISSKEHELENLLKAKGFNESLVTIGQRLVSIIIAAKLKPDEARSIGQLAAEVTSFNLDQIQIVER